MQAFCGIGTCFPTGITETGKDGRYTLRFAPGSQEMSAKADEVPLNFQGRRST